MALPLAALAIIAAALGAVGSLGSSGIQYAANKSLQDDAQSFNAHEAQLARAFTAQEAATARQFSHDEAQLARDFEATKYQRTVADMQAAGLNPASVVGGSGAVSSASPVAASQMAGSPGGASSGIGSLSNPNLGNILTSAFNSAMIEQLKNERFVDSLVERTAYHANLIDTRQRKFSDPDWLKEVMQNFDSGVTDL